MPDKRSNRGPDPRDTAAFAPSRIVALRAATVDLSWLRSRGYAETSALKIVGDRYSLTARQRAAVRRSSCSDDSLSRRTTKQVGGDATRGAALGIDGYNLLITVETALSGGVVLAGRDGCYRDLAGVHGTYRKVRQTHPAIEIIIDVVRRLDPGRVDVYLDRPVSNSGRLKALMAEVIEQKLRMPVAESQWNIEISDHADSVLRGYAGVVSTSDCVILETCTRWINLARMIIEENVHRPWIVSLP